MERVMAWRIHQVAYVENLYPRRYSNFFVDVCGNHNHLLEHLLLVIKTREGRLELPIQFLKFSKALFASRLAVAPLPLGIFLIDLLIERSNLLDQLTQRTQVLLAPF